MARSILGVTRMTRKRLLYVLVKKSSLNSAKYPLYNRGDRTTVINDDII